MQFLIVFLGGGLGAVLRHGVNLLALRVPGAGAFPWSTLCVNVVGSLLMGALTAYFVRHGGGSMDARLFLATGVLGGFTTFSAFSLDVVLLVQRGEPGLALLYALASVCLSVAALLAGLAVMRAWLPA